MSEENTEQEVPEDGSKPIVMEQVENTVDELNQQPVVSLETLDEKNSPAAAAEGDKTVVASLVEVVNSSDEHILLKNEEILAVHEGEKLPAGNFEFPTERMVVYDAPSMISDLETHLQFFIRPEFQYLEVLCHISGFAEYTAYLYLDLSKLMSAVTASMEHQTKKLSSALSEFLLPRLALKPDEVDLNRWKLLLFLHPFQKHAFTGDYGGQDVSSNKFREPPIFQQVIVNPPDGFEVTPWPTVIDSASLNAGDIYLNHFHGSDDLNDAGSRRGSVRSSLFAKAWLGPAPSSNYSVRSSVVASGETGNAGEGSAADVLVSPGRSSSVVQLPRINPSKTGSVMANMSEATRNGEELISPTVAAVNLATQMLYHNNNSSNNNNSNSNNGHHHTHHSNQQSSGNNNNHNINNNNGNNHTSFFPKIADAATLESILASPVHHGVERRHSFEVDSNNSSINSTANNNASKNSNNHTGEKHIYDFLIGNPGPAGASSNTENHASQQQQQQTQHHVSFVPSNEEMSVSTTTATGTNMSTAISGSNSNTSGKHHSVRRSVHLTPLGSTNTNTAASSSSSSTNISTSPSKSSREHSRLQRRSLGNATFDSTPNNIHQKGVGHSEEASIKILQAQSNALGAGNNNNTNNNNNNSNGSTKSTRLMRRSFGMDPLSARALEIPPSSSASSSTIATTNNASSNNNNNNAAAAASVTKLPSLTNHNNNNAA